MNLETSGRRIYFKGNTYPHKDALRAAGAKWDADARAWYVGSQRKELAERLVAQATATPSASSQPTDGVSTDARVINGRATYKGKSYYLLWAGTTRRGQAAKLCFRDGSKVFWADLSEVTIEKQYREATSIDALRRFAERAKQRESDGLSTTPDYPGKECPCCGSEPLNGALYCWECGYQGHR